MTVGNLVRTQRVCPVCAGRGTSRVTETRERTDGSLRRRIRCLACGSRWTTRERIVALERSPRSVMDAFDPGI